MAVIWLALALRGICPFSHNYVAAANSLTWCLGDSLSALASSTSQSSVQPSVAGLGSETSNRSQQQARVAASQPAPVPSQPCNGNGNRWLADACQRSI